MKNLPTIGQSHHLCLQIIWQIPRNYIRLHRNEFRGQMTSPNQNSFGKCPMQETAPTIESYPIKMSQKNVAMRMERSEM